MEDVMGMRMASAHKDDPMAFTNKRVERHCL
jgi:hypothetical protein